jgi:hypothetical protein
MDGDKAWPPGPVSVVRREARRRWAVVACGVAVLCAVPVLIASLPVPPSPLTAAALRSRILASSGAAYQGYAESSVDLGLPSLPFLGNVSLLLDGITDQYAWYRSSGHWRADIVTGTGESDTYQVGPAVYQWSYGRDLLTRIVGDQPVRLPRAADLLPPALARRLLGFASPADHLARLPAQRIAGVDAAGLRLVPADPDTTVGSVSIWADPRTGLPVEVAVTSRGASQPVLVARFLDLSERRPALATVTPAPAPGVGVATAELPDVSGILNGFGPPLPRQLAGNRRVAVPGGLADVAAYGAGFSRFAVLTLPFRDGISAMNAAQDAGAAQVSLAGGTGITIQTPLLTVLLARSQFGGPVYLLTGAVTADLLHDAASALLLRPAAP